ncbi:tetratricopeptide repeat protein [Alkalicaulis satelles]|uniref:Tetratricopeptide repeat protein n=1 Tax=Alkalicaulis satelles TaxID=2609175 RepID=A0A5M6ZJ42_9PROT|nr:tetratricopeptide repeat protein [Alkalicaulis satelles]KAA5804832.1 tetratricopeptide repeat protein [Alkalicaulis satelles]
MADAFDEVEEELRRERYQALLRKWGPWVAAAAVAIVLGAAGYQYQSYASRQASDAASDAYQAAASLYEAGAINEADNAFAALAESGPRGYAALALMRRAAIAQSMGDMAEAARLYEQAAERSPESLSRDLARYRAVLVLFDELSLDDLNLRLQPLTRPESNVGPLARELMAAAALRDERWEDARRRYELLTFALDAPPGVQRRAQEALAFIAQNAPPAEAEPEIIGDSAPETDAAPLDLPGEADDGAALELPETLRRVAGETADEESEDPLEMIRRIQQQNASGEGSDDEEDGR